MRTLEVPKEVVKFAERWATAFTIRHPRWRKDKHERDIWYSYRGYDLNLYACEGDLSITAYLEVNQDNGDIMTDTSTYKTIARR